MARIETWFNQDLKKPVKVQYLDGNVFSQDNYGNVVGVRVYDNGTPADLAGTVSANVIRSDGGTVALQGTIMDGYRVYVVLPQAAYYVPGVISIVIKLATDSATTTLCAVVANVYQSSTDTAIDPGTIISSIDTLISEIDSAVASIPLDYSDLQNAVASVQKSIHGAYNIEYTSMIKTGGYIRYITSGTYQPGDLMPVTTTQNGIYTDFIPIGDAKEASIYTAGNTGSAVIAFYDGSKQYISGVVGEGQAVLKTFTSTIPSSAKFVRFSAYSASVAIAELSRCFVGLPNAMVSVQKKIQANTDLNDIKDNGVYLCYGGYTYTNVPANYVSGSFYLSVIGFDGTQAIQIFYKTSTNTMSIRTYFTSSGVGTWSSWTLYDTSKSLIGKKFSILGDSISTYQGYLPSGYVSYYPEGNLDSVDKTWWKQVESISGMELLANASWSGSGVCDDDNDPTNTARIAYSDARINDLSSGGVDPDIIIILIGTNDFRHDETLGSLLPSQNVPDGTTSIREFYKAYACMVNKIRNKYTHAHVYCCTILTRYSAGDSTYPVTNGNNNAISEFNNAIETIAKWMGCNIIPLHTVFSLGEIPSYTVDSALHPNAAGAKLVANRIFQSLMENERYYLTP